MTNNFTVKTVVTLFMLLLLGFCSLQARVVISVGKQNEMLQAARSLLSPSSKQLPNEIKDPFQRKIAPPVQVVVEEVPEVVERELTDAELLALASIQLKPSGFIDQGGEQYLILNGKKVQDGFSFNFPNNNKRYSIKITQIQTHSFTLNLNSESKTISME